MDLTLPESGFFGDPEDDQHDECVLERIAVERAKSLGRKKYQLAVIGTHFTASWYYTKGQ